MKSKNESLLKKPSIQTLIASLICILLGLLIGFIVLLFINPSGAGGAILAIVKNFFKYPSGKAVMKYFGSTLVKSAPLLMCSLSVLFAYKVGLFNIGAAGQYAVGAGIGLAFALNLNLPWYVCLLAGTIAGALLGAISGILKAYCNVNEVISGIMLNWISLYLMNLLLTSAKEEASHYTKIIANNNPSALMPKLGLDKLFSNNQYVTIAIPVSVLIAILIYVILEKTKFGYELKATGYNKHAAKYCGMAENKNTIVSLMIGGALAGIGGAMYYLCGYEQWSVTASSVPAMGFNGIAAAFLGGLSPIGSIFSSFFIQHITEGGAYVDKTMYCSQISDLISSIIIYLCGFVGFMKYVMDKKVKDFEARKIEQSVENADNSGKEDEK